jgi:hypothetical protein
MTSRVTVTTRVFERIEQEAVGKAFRPNSFVANEDGSFSFDLSPEVAEKLQALFPGLDLASAIERLLFPTN